MRTYYQGPTYTVVFDEGDTGCFTRHTEADPEVVRGRGAFVFDSFSGDLVTSKGSARGRDDMQWLAFSQDAQEHARKELRMHGVAINPYEFGCQLPEIANPDKGGKAKLGRTVVMETPGKVPTSVRAGEEGRIVNIDDEGVIYVEWEGGEESSLAKDDKFRMPKAWNPPAAISRTRGVKTMHGPYSAKKGYKPWIRRRGKLGEGFLTTMSKKQREESLDRCVKAYGYRSCLGSILVLERAKRGPRGTGEGVGVKYAKELKSSRDYLKEKFGGVGSFGPREKKQEVARAAEHGPGYRANPDSAEHERRAYAYLREGEDAIRRGMGHYESAQRGGMVRATVGKEVDEACAYARDAHKYAILAQHEVDDSNNIGAKKSAHFLEAVSQLRASADAMLDRLSCAWAS